MTKEELLQEARGLDRCELQDADTDIEDLMKEAIKLITNLEQQVAYWKLSFNKQCEATRTKD